MLIDEPRVLRGDPILDIVGRANGNHSAARALMPGVYEIPHFGSSAFLGDFDHYPEGLSVDSYGVCDSAEQLLERCPELAASNRQFVVTLTSVRKADQSPSGGWRWHKWGDYIGDKTPTREYLHDEPDIDQVFVYHIYEKA